MKPFQLTVAQSSALEKGMPISVLSRTFQEAVTITRRLGVRYLWIDSLCIVQSGDGGRDWTVEAPTMDQVYMHSFCNIAADFATAPDVALFFDRSPRWFERLRLLVTRLEDRPPATEEERRDIKKRHIQLREYQRSKLRGTGGERGDNDCDYFGDNQIEWPSFRRYGPLGTKPTECYISEVIERAFVEVEQAPLNTRGWVYQERLFAPRILHFGRYQVYWECREKRLSENFPTGLPSVYGSDSRAWGHQTNDLKALIVVPTTIDVLESRSPRKNSMYLHERWCGIVEQYTSHFLTRDTDRLVAISGIARRLRPAVNSLYVAGIWVDFIVQDILWSVTGPRQQRDLSTSYHAPSWSWASMGNSSVKTKNGYLSPPHVTFTCHASIVKAKEVHDAAGRFYQPIPSLKVTEDVYGPLAAPVYQLELAGDLREIRISPVASYFGVGPQWNIAFPDRRYLGAIDLDFEVSGPEKTAFFSQVFGLFVCAKGACGGMHCLVVELLRPDHFQYRRVDYYVQDDFYLPGDDDEVRLLSLPAVHNADASDYTIYLV
jgi:hypothetical protein